MAQPTTGAVPMARDDGRGKTGFPRVALDDALDVWREEWEKDLGEALTGEHASPEQLARMADFGGLVDAEPGLVDHLSRCPRCLGEWATLVRATTGLDELRRAPGLDYGLFEAAATRSVAHSRTLHTVSGTYELTLSPGVSETSRGLVILEVTGASAPELEGHRVTVRARASGEVLVDGIVRRGNLAQRHENLAAIDLSRGWTVVVDF